MTLAVLAFAAIAITLTAAYVLTTRVETAEALAGETTFSDAAASAETLSGGCHYSAPSQTDWQLTTVSALCDAEELLDMLENQGIAERELLVLGNSCFAVRWR